MSDPKHTPTPARDAALGRAWAERPELGNEERSAFICGFEAGWNAATPRRAAGSGGRVVSGPKHTPTPGPWRLLAAEGETVVVGPGDEYVAFISSGEVPDDPDGLLVAAAPRLAKALRLTLAALISSPEGELLATYGAITDRLLGVQAAIDDARAALREAGFE